MSIRSTDHFAKDVIRHRASSNERKDQKRSELYHTNEVHFSLHTQNITLTLDYMNTHVYALWIQQIWILLRCFDKVDKKQALVIRCVRLHRLIHFLIRRGRKIREACNGKVNAKNLRHWQFFLRHNRVIYRNKCDLDRIRGM